MVDLREGFDGLEGLGPSEEEKRKKSSEEKKDFSKEEMLPPGERLASAGDEKKEDEKISLSDRIGKKEMLLEPEPVIPGSDLAKAEALYGDILNFITPIFDKVAAGSEGQLKGEEIIEQVRQFAERLHGSITPGDMVRLVFRHDEYKENYIYSHSVNVCLLTTYVAMSLNFSKEKLLNLVIASLFYDIGMMKIPLKVWNKAGRLSDGEYEEVKKHVLYGEEIFKNLQGIDPEVPLMIGQHQERVDGSGYPRGLSKDGIHYGARLLAVLDRYETGTHSRLYKPRELPDKAIQQILDNEAGTFDRHFLKVLLRQVSMFPIGTLVKISSGEIGEVGKVNEDTPMRPVIKIIYSREMHPLEGRLLDLSKQLLIHVDRCIDLEELK